MHISVHASLQYFSCPFLAKLKPFFQNVSYFSQINVADTMIVNLN